MSEFNRLYNPKYDYWNKQHNKIKREFHNYNGLENQEEPMWLFADVVNKETVEQERSKTFKAWN